MQIFKSASFSLSKKGVILQVQYLFNCRRMHIAIAGNIGAGKTSLTELLAKHYGWEAHFEDVIDNPYLDDFYNHMERWSFNLQIYF